MTQEDKELLLKDLCARLPYRVKVQTPVMNDEITLTCGDISAYFFNPDNKLFLKPYLRPISTITDEELTEFLEIRGRNFNSEELRTFREKEIAIVSTLFSYSKHIDWLNAHHFDYRGLIEKGLAITITKENNPYKK